MSSPSTDVSEMGDALRSAAAAASSCALIMTPCGYMGSERCLAGGSGDAAAAGSSSLRRPTRTATTSISEVERAKITQESLYKRVCVSYAMHAVVSLLLLVPYVVLVELFLLSTDCFCCLLPRPDGPEPTSCSEQMFDESEV